MDESSISKGSYNSYDVYEEECVETLSDDDDNINNIKILPPHLMIAHRKDPYNHQGRNSVQYVEEEEEVIDGEDSDVDEVEYVDEEIIDSTYHHVSSLPGISEEGDDENDADPDPEDDDDEEEVVEEVLLTDNDTDDEGDEYDEVEIQMNGSQSIYSGSEVEVLVETDDDDDDEPYDEILIEDYYDDYENDDEHDVNIEVIHDHHDATKNSKNGKSHHHSTTPRVHPTTTRRVSEESQNGNQSASSAEGQQRSFQKDRSFTNRNVGTLKKSSFRIRPHYSEQGNHSSNSNNYSSSNDDEHAEDYRNVPDVDGNYDDVVNDDDDNASAEELTEAIEYVLRQERAVSKLILTEEQASKMAHLPIPVMKIIVDHLEICDNEQQPIDWDFLLKIVCPYCDE